MNGSLVHSMKNRFGALHRNESGMEAAQVILILFLVVVFLIPILWIIKGKLGDKGTDIGNCIDTPEGCTG